MKNVSFKKQKSLFFIFLLLCLGGHLFAQAEQLLNGTFDSGVSPWWASANVSLRWSNGEAVISVSGGSTNAWDDLMSQDNVLLTPGETYELSLDLRGTPGETIKVVVQLGSSPYTSAFVSDITLTNVMTTHNFIFSNTLDTDKAQFQFQLGGKSSSYSFTVDNVSLKGGAASSYEPDTGPEVRVNQMGYVTEGPKKATFVTEATTPFTWRLKNSSGVTVSTGQTTYFGYDALAGDTAHLIDFTSYTTEGTNYVLEVNGITSYPFDIRDDIYENLKYDALAYFYHNRSGIAIEAQYVGSAYARPAGHIGVAPNQGDTNVPTAPDTVASVGSYSLDVSGGWYDAGDHGKYVVNGGISVWKILNQYERTLYAAGGDSSAFADNTMAIPEQGNGVPDILDEVRWQMEFMLKMQVPDGQIKAGMAHHKIHDAAWTGLPLLPSEDPQPRYLRPPSVTATLNLAATAAMSARIWADIDSAFSAKCLTAAEKAWNAALAHPTDYALNTDGTGGGSYDDTKAEDEFYWAAAELFITTGKTVYQNYLLSSEFASGKGITTEGFYWAACAPLGYMSLAQVPNNLPVYNLNTIKNAILNVSDELVDNIGRQAYPNVNLPKANYEWGSNNGTLNDVIILGTAYDLTGTKKYLDAAFETMDYILGRNALNFSYVSGYGDVSLSNPHHRHWAHQLDPSMPPPPPGCLSGGPNSGLEDPIAQKFLGGLPSGKSFIDDIGSWSTNEVTINWNSALSWAVAFVSEKASAGSETGILGDVDNSGVVNIVDALMVAQSYVGLFTLPNPVLGDVNCSGTVDILDALLIAQKAVGLISTFPCEL